MQDEARRSGHPAAMEQRMSLITLGYGDLERARDFYTALGWTIGWTDDDVVFFQAGGMIFALWDRAKLTEDSGVQDSGGWGGVTFAHLVGSPGEVDEVLAQAKAAGATIPRAGARRPWGGYSGIFVDPEGHPWEVAHNPSWTLHEDGSVTLS
jgi:catechol 2,3-dioxygenase-like lactoylglutathione lyase family enzyme